MLKTEKIGFTLKKVGTPFLNKTDKLMGIYSELGNRKTAFPKDMSFKEIYDNKLFVPAQFYDSASIKCSGVEIEDFILKKTTH